jgi:hypothetical protein
MLKKQAAAEGRSYPQGRIRHFARADSFITLAPARSWTQ